LTGDEAHDRLTEILGRHVDVGLLDALWLQQGRDLDALALGQTSLSARLDAASGGASNGGDDLLVRVDEHHAQWFTPTGREKADLTRLDARVEALQGATHDLRARLAEIDTESGELDEVERTLPGLERDLTEALEPALEAARDDRRSLQALQSQRETLQARFEQADTVCAAAREVLDRRRAATESIATLTDRVAAVEVHLQPSDDELADLAERRRIAQETARDAQEALRVARRDGDHAQWRVDLLEASEEHARRKGRLSRARAVIDDAAEAQAAVDASRIDDDLFTEIGDADAAMRLLEARVDAGAPTVRLRAVSELSGDIDGEAFQLAEGDALERSVRAHLRLRLSAFELEVVAGDPDHDVHDELDVARRHLADRCERAGVEDLSEAERLVTLRRAHEQTLRQRDVLLDRELDGASLDELADTVEASRARIDQLLARRPAPQDTNEEPDTTGSADATDLDEARRTRDACTRATDAAELVHQQAAADLADIVERHESMRDRHAERRRELDGLRRELERDRSQLASERASRADDELSRALVEATATRDAAREALDAADQRLAALDPERVELVETAACNARDAALEHLGRLRQRRTELGVRLATVGAEGLGEQLTDTEAQLERAELDQERERRRAQAARLLRDELHAARDELHRAYRAPLRDRIERMSSLLLDEDVAIELDDELRIATRTRGGTTLGWHQLSAGAREQLAILTALAAAQLAGDDGVPFILDDALGYTDPQRMATLGALLGRTEGAQVIVLTCVPERFRTTGARTVPLLTS
ncbi:MAG: hypothetical protein WD041_05820, partial [Nitriliruptoraceae bacterium]